MGLLPDSVREQLQSGVIYVANLVELEFTFGTERYWSGIYPLEFEGHTWLPTGDMGNISPIESSAELRANGSEITLSLPIDETAEEPVARFQNVRAAQYKNRGARQILAFFDAEFQNVLFTMPRRMVMDSLSYSVDPSRGSVISMRLESELFAAGKTQVRRWTDAQQRLDHPEDLAFQFLSYLSSGVEIRWGSTGAFFR